MKVLLSHPTGNSFVRYALKGLFDAQSLIAFYTTVACFPKSNLEKISNFQIFNEFKRRKFDGRFQRITETSPFFEIGRMVANKFKFSNLTKHETGIFCVDRVYNNLDFKVSKSLSKYDDLDAIYAYEDGAFESFKLAKELGIKCLYDLPIGYWKSMRRLLQEEMINRPDWTPTLTGFKDSEYKLKRKDEELKMADVVFVASSFTAKTLEEYSGGVNNIRIVPYGFPKTINKKDYKPLANRKLRLLFVGGLSQRKGIANLFEAVEILSDKVELTLVGKKPVENCTILNECVSKYHWIPSLPHNEVLELMQVHDILVFPSLFEGFGLVITESMSQGTPVITTNRTCGADLIDDNVNGWIVEPGKTESLVEKLKFILDNPSQIGDVGKLALETAKKRTWDVYASEIAKEINSLGN